MKLKEIAIKAQYDSNLLYNLLNLLRFKYGFRQKDCVCFLSKYWQVSQDLVESFINDMDD